MTAYEHYSKDEMSMCIAMAFFAAKVLEAEDHNVCDLIRKGKNKRRKDFSHEILLIKALFELAQKLMQKEFCDEDDDDFWDFKLQMKVD